jgi:hypothetical protein
VFDDILLNHFETLAERKLPGRKKVQDREYAIEDAFTRVPFSREQSWDSFSQPGRKIEMSMIFKNINDTRVVCPKCNSVSNEKKGVLVEWSGSLLWFVVIAADTPQSKFPLQDAVPNGR